jgi:hypothetical protein
VKRSAAALRDLGYVLLDDRLPAGHDSIPVPDHVFLPPRRSPNSPKVVFATVQVGAGPTPLSPPRIPDHPASTYQLVGTGMPSL